MGSASSRSAATSRDRSAGCSSRTSAPRSSRSSHPMDDLGAEVIKIEPPDGGDQIRSVEPFIDGESSPFMRLNRNKRSLVVDLKSADGKEVFKKLVRSADIVVENLRPGTMGDLALDYHDVLN